MVEMLLTLRGATDGSSTSGDFSLTSDMIYGTITYLRIPKGMKAKIWCKRISGQPVQVIMNFTKDVTVASPTWTEIDREVLSAAGELTLEKRRPLVINGTTGKEAIKFSWSQSTAALSYISVEVELTDE